MDYVRSGLNRWKTRKKVSLIWGGGGGKGGGRRPEKEEGRGGRLLDSGVEIDDDVDCCDEDFGRDEDYY